MSEIYQHFRVDEKEFIDQVLDWKYQVEQMYAPKLTDFLDPRQQFIIQAIIGENQEVQSSFHGGFSNTERKRCLLYPDYYEPSQEDFLVGVYEIDYPKKFITLEHRQVLGSIMSLGVVREKFGDIVVNGDRIQFSAVSEIEDYLVLELNQIGKAAVKVKKVENDYLQSNERWAEVEKTISSLRLDVVIAGALNMSRQKSLTLIQAGRVKVNFEQMEQNAFECEKSDIISIRGFGMVKLMELSGRTRKDKIRVKFGLLK